MYVRREKSWLKHLDFGILDVISIIVAFYIGYVCRHGADSGMANYYVRLLCILIGYLCILDQIQSYRNRAEKLSSGDVRVCDTLCVD